MAPKALMGNASITEKGTDQLSIQGCEKKKNKTQ